MLDFILWPIYQIMKSVGMKLIGAIVISILALLMCIPFTIVGDILWLFGKMMETFSVANILQGKAFSGTSVNTYIFGAYIGFVVFIFLFTGVKSVATANKHHNSKIIKIWFISQIKFVGAMILLPIIFTVTNLIVQGLFELMHAVDRNVPKVVDVGNMLSILINDIGKVMTQSRKFEFKLDPMSNFNMIFDDFWGGIAKALGWLMISLITIFALWKYLLEFFQKFIEYLVSSFKQMVITGIEISNSYDKSSDEISVINKVALRRTLAITMSHGVSLFLIVLQSGSVTMLTTAFKKIFSLMGGNQFGDMFNILIVILAFTAVESVFGFFWEDMESKLDMQIYGKLDIMKRLWNSTAGSGIKAVGGLMAGGIAGAALKNSEKLRTFNNKRKDLKANDKQEKHTSTLEGMKHAINNDNTLSAEEKSARIKKVEDKHAAKAAKIQRGIDTRQSKLSQIGEKRAALATRQNDRKQVLKDTGNNIKNGIKNIPKNVMSDAKSLPSTSFKGMQLFLKNVQIMDKQLSSWNGVKVGANKNSQSSLVDRDTFVAKGIAGKSNPFDKKK